MDVNGYWLERGKTYYKEERLKGQFYLDQEQLFLAVSLSLKPKYVVDVGCGFGRMTKVLAEAMPGSRFVGLDLSPHQIKNAKDSCRDLINVVFLQHDLCSDVPLPRGFDLAVCCEVLLHHPHDAAIKVVQEILKSAQTLIHEVDPNWRREDFTAGHCFFHDYEQIYDDLGLTHRRIDDKGQRVLVVG